MKLSGSRIRWWVVGLVLLTAGLRAEEAVAPAKVVMNDELMARLIKLTRAQTNPGSIPGRVAALFGLGDGSDVLRVLMVETERPAGLYLAIPAAPAGSPDIVIVAKPDEYTLECYLTDKDRKLRAAAVDHQQKVQLVLNESVAEKFAAALTHLAQEAAEDLPPSSEATK